ncbi:MAG: hypothetical protein KDC60_05600 [Bacteroidetes bacterium]|nr:hypothetical protein [Bacteroidota bacterium]MCB9074434.1 hypothetical protein [Chitinophagales bacterium]
MKNQMKLLMLAFAIVAFTFSANAELGLKYSALAKEKKTASTSGSGAAAKGNFIIQADFNLGSTHPGLRTGGYWGGYYGYGGFVPGFTLNLDYNVHDYASVGGYIGYGARHGLHHLAVGARGTFHWWQLLDDKVSADLKSDKIDFYMPVHLGVYMYMGGGTTARFNGGAGLGFRYYFVDNIGVNMEWGRQEMSWAKIGVQFKL